MSTSPITQVKKFLRWIGFDQALSYVIWGKLWQVFAGPITILMIARYLNPEAQGYYYTFMSLVAMRILIEFGFNTIIIQFASHEWSELHVVTPIPNSARNIRNTSMPQIINVHFVNVRS